MSSGSPIVDLDPMLAHVVARAFDPHPERRLADARELRHFAVLHLLADVEEERLAMREVESRERLHEPSPRLHRSRRARHPNVVRRAVADDPLPPRGPPPGPRAAAVHEDAEEPGAKRVALVVAAQRAERADERFLHGVLRIGVVAEEVAREAETARMVPAHQLRAGRITAGPRSRHPVRVASCIRDTHGFTVFPGGPGGG